MERLKALKSMMGEPMIGLKKKSEFEGESDMAKGMVSMLVSPEEKEMILAQREGAEPSDEMEAPGGAEDAMMRSSTY